MVQIRFVFEGKLPAACCLKYVYSERKSKEETTFQVQNSERYPKPAGFSTKNSHRTGIFHFLKPTSEVFYSPLSS
jgi:hypothetical protein